MILFEIILVSAVGGLIALDKTAAFQVMISRPIVAAPLVGLLLGDPMTGLKAGLVLELLWIGHLPVGADLPPDETIVSILISAVSIWCLKISGGISEEIISLAFIIAFPAAILSQRMESYVRKINISSAHAADRAADNLDFSGIGREFIKGLGRLYLGYVCMLFVLLSAVVMILSNIYLFMPDFVLTGLKRFYYILLVIGVVSTLSTVRVKGSPALFLRSFIVTSLLFEVFEGE